MISNKRITGFLRSSHVKNGIWLYLLQFFNTVIPLITIPYVTRILGKGGYGTFNIAFNIIVYLQVLVEYGFGMSATREVAISDKNNRFISKLYTCVICSRFLLFLLSIVIAISYLVITKADRTVSLCLIVMVSCLLGYCVQQNWLFQGMQEMKYISIINIASRTISTILIFSLVKKASDIVLYGVLYSVSPFLSGIIGLVIAKIKYKLKFQRITINDIAFQIKNGWYVFTTQLSSKVFGAIGITFLGLFATNEDVGVFSAIQKIPNIMMLAWSPISQVLYPINSQKMKDSFLNGRQYVKKTQKLVLLLAFLFALIVGIFSKPIVRIAFGAEYEESFYWIIPLLVWIILGINNNFLGIQTLLASGHDKEYSICFQIGMGCTIAVNFVFVFLFKGLGASIAPMVSEAILLVLLLLKCKKIEKQAINTL